MEDKDAKEDVGVTAHKTDPGRLSIEYHENCEVTVSVSSVIRDMS